MNRQNLYILVTYAGALPFIACAVMLYSGINEVSMLGSVDQIAIICGLLIISFIAGIHLGTYLLYETKTPKTLFLLSNIIAAITWFSVLVAPAYIAVITLTIAFGYLLLVDFLLRRENLISHSYFNTRVIVTAITALTLLFTVSAT